MKLAALLMLATLGAGDQFQARSAYSPCNPYNEYCAPQLGTPLVDAGTANVVDTAAVGILAGNQTKPGPTMKVYSPYFDGGNWLDGGDFTGVVTLRNGAVGGTGEPGNPVVFIQPGTPFDGGFVCMIGFNTGFNGSVGLNSNTWATFIQDGGCYLVNGEKVGFTTSINNPATFQYFFFGL